MSVSVSRWVLPIAICVFVTGLCAPPGPAADGSEPSLPESYVRETFKAWVETNLKGAKVSGLNGYQYEFKFGDRSDGMVRLSWISERTRQQQLAAIGRASSERKGDINGCPAMVFEPNLYTTELLPHGEGGAHIKWVHGEWLLELNARCSLTSAGERATRKAAVLELARLLDVAIWGEAHDIDCSVVFLIDFDAFGSGISRNWPVLDLQLRQRTVKLDAHNRTARAESKDLVEWAVLAFGGGKVIVARDFTTVDSGGGLHLLSLEFLSEGQPQVSPLVWAVTQALVHLRTRGRGKVGMLEIITWDPTADPRAPELPEAVRDRAIDVKKLIQVLDYIGWWRLRGPGSTGGGN